MQNSLSSICNRAIEYLFYALFFFVPLIFLPVTSELFEFNKMILTYAISILIAGFWAVKMVINGQFRVQRTPLDIPILLFLASQVISTILSIDPHTSIWGYYSRSNGGLLSIISYIFLYYAFVSNFRNTSEEINQPLSIKKKFFVPAVVMLVIGFFVLALFLNDSLLTMLINQLTRLMESNAVIEFIILMIGLLFQAFAAIVVTFSNLPFIPFFRLFQITPDLIFITLYIISIFLLFLFSFRGPSIKRLFMIILISGAIVAFYGVLEHFGIDKDKWVQDVQNRVFSTLGQPNWLGAYLSILVPLSIVFGLESLIPKTTPNAKIETRKWMLETKKILLTSSFYFLASSLFYLTILYTKSRSGFLGLWVGLAFFFVATKIISNIKFQISNFKSKLLEIGNLELVIIGIILLTFLIGSPFEQLNKWTLSGLKKSAVRSQPSETSLAKGGQLEVKPQGTALETGGTESGEIRKIVWQGAIDIARHYPLFGSGVETFAYSYYQYRPVEHNLTSEWDFLYNKAHNEYLNYLATTGVFGLGSYLVIIIVFLLLSIGKISNLKFTIFNENLKLKIKNYDNYSSSTILSFALIAAYLSILVSNFFGFSVVVINLFFFLIPAMVFVLSGQLNIQHSFVFPRVPSLSKAKMENFQWVLIILALVASGYLLVAIYNVWSSDIDYAVGKQYNRAGEYKQAHDYLVNARQRRPDEPLFADELAVNNAALALISLEQNQSTAAANFAKEAVGQSTYATNASPNNPTFWRSRIRVFTALSQMDEKYYADARKAAQKSTELSPTDPEIFYNYALILAQTGNIEEAIEQLKKSQTLKPDYREPIYALGIFYHEVGTPEYLNLAISQMEKLLKIASTDSQAQEKLKEWRGY